MQKRFKDLQLIVPVLNSLTSLAPPSHTHTHNTQTHTQHTPHHTSLPSVFSPSQGFALKTYLELLGSLLEVLAVQKRFKDLQLIVPVLNSLMSLRSLVMQRTKLTDDSERQLRDLLNKLTSGMCFFFLLVCACVCVRLFGSLCVPRGGLLVFLVRLRACVACCKCFG